MAVIYMQFPGGVSKALTLSYDDGVVQDIRLMEILQKYRIKCTFNLNSGLFGDEAKKFPAGQNHPRLTKQQAQELYQNSGMEVAAHGLHHPFLEHLPPEQCVQELMEDRRNLEAMFGGTVRGCAYPYGTFNSDVEQTLRLCGYAYARSIDDQMPERTKYELPADWFHWRPTCHHTEERLLTLAQKYVELKAKRARVFYLWGHSYEFDEQNNWDLIEQFCQIVSGKSDIWYATNMEIYNYVEAYRRLRFNADGTFVENPSDTDVCFVRDMDAFCVRAGSSMKF